MNGLGKIFLALLIACLIVLGVLTIYHRSARAQSNGWFSACSTWTSRETVYRGGVAYVPKADSWGDSTVCLGGGDGILYLLVYQGTGTNLGFIPLDGIPIWF